MFQAWGAVLTSIVSMSASLYLISVTPWYLLPFAWFVAGTAFTGVRRRALPQPCVCIFGRACLARKRARCALMSAHGVCFGCAAARPTARRSQGTLRRRAPRPQWFVVGHDCGHRSFSSNKLLEDIVGTLAFMPLIYPFEPWRIKHNQHHAQTNKCAGGRGLLGRARCFARRCTH